MGVLQKDYSKYTHFYRKYKKILDNNRVQYPNLKFMKYFYQKWAGHLIICDELIVGSLKLEEPCKFEVLLGQDCYAPHF